MDGDLLLVVRRHYDSKWCASYFRGRDTGKDRKKEQTGRDSHKYEERDEGANAGTREMIAGPVRRAERTERDRTRSTEEGKNNNK